MGELGDRGGCSGRVWGRIRMGVILRMSFWGY